MTSTVRFPLTAETWRDRHEDVVRAIFGPGGVLYRHRPGFVPEPAQVAYARALAAAAVRGTDPALAGRVTMLEAGTGVGKTLTYLVVGLITALLTGKRFMVSTYTRQLLGQVVGDEADLARAVVAEVLGSTDGRTWAGRQIGVAPRRPRRAFVSPSRARLFAEEVEANDDAGGAAALRAYADMADAATSRIEGDGATAVVTALDGLIETFEFDAPDHAAALAELPVDRYNLLANSPDREQTLWKAYSDAANSATAVCVTHAAFVIDMSLRGRLTNAAVDGFAFVVIDEAHRLEDAARSAFQTKRSVGELLRDAARVREAAREVDLPPADRIRLEGAVDRYEEAATSLHEQVRSDAMSRPDHVTSYEVGPALPRWFPALADVRRTMQHVCVALVAANTPVLAAFAEQFDEREEALSRFASVVSRRAGTGKTDLVRAMVSLTPTKREPSLQVVPVFGARIAERIWWKGKDGDRAPLADAVVFTSATLGNPAVEGWDAFSAMSWTLGVSKARGDVNVDLCGRHEPGVFGHPAFVWADPAAPSMSFGGGRMTEEAASYVASAVTAAVGMRHPVKGTARTVVLTMNSEDPEVIKAALPQDVRDRCVTRRRGQSLGKAFEAWILMEDGVLITPGAWEGFNLPGLIDHLVIYKVPYRPLPGEGEPEVPFAAMRSEMIQRFRQGLGRAIRRRDDDPVIWILDSRVPLPGPVANRNMVFSCRKSVPHYLKAFPARFQRAMDKGSIHRVQAA